jgi:hypothetical protein
MLPFKLRPYVGKVSTESEKTSIADLFREVMVGLHLEYDLPPDVWAAAEDVLQALKAREKHWSALEAETSGIAYL